MARWSSMATVRPFATTLFALGQLMLEVFWTATFPGVTEYQPRLVVLVAVML